MQHPVELRLHQYMEDAVNGKSTMSEETLTQVASEIVSAMKKQFDGIGSRKDFKLRMSNIGRPSCQLWFEKNHPEKALPLPTTFIMNMMIGDIVEAVFKGLLREAGVTYKDTEKVSLSIDKDTTIDGSYDLVIDDAVDDVKSASPWSYANKFASYEAVQESDPFGYVGQLAGYAKASGYRPGGWWVVNKGSGEFKYVSAANMNVDEVIEDLTDNIKNAMKPDLTRMFEPEEEKFRGKPTGNKVLNDKCKFCSYRFECWPTLQELPAVMSQAKEPKIVPYVNIKEEFMKNDN